MTRKLVKSDLAAILDLASCEPSLNIWIIADLENFGLETDSLDVWGAFCDSNLQAVVLRFRQHFVPYSPDRILPDGLVDMLRAARPRSLSGAAPTIKAIADALGFGPVRMQYLAELKQDGLRPYTGPPVDVVSATTADA